ncbi:MAG: hypothetical protein ABI847_20300, partial [Anaerolineales bacterium]
MSATVAAATLTATAQPTSQPTSNSLFPIMTPHDAYPGVTPIATPDVDTQGYRLKEWSESDAVALVTLLETYAHDNDLEAPAHGRWNFPKAYQTVRLALQEAGFRYPALAGLDEFKWHTAMVDAILLDNQSDEWIIASLESGLNTGLFTPTDLNSELLAYGFRVAEELPAPNLFGDGRLAQVLRIQTQDAYVDDGFILAFAQDDAGQFQVTPIYVDWNIEIGLDDIVEVQDRTGNGIPEVLLDISGSSGSLCFGKIYSFEWQSGQFVDLTRGQIAYRCDSAWKISEDASHTAIIEAPNWPSSLNQYQWNGSIYALAHRQLYLVDPFCDGYGQTLLRGWSDFQQGITETRAVIADAATVLTPSCRDYLRFQIGLTYAEQGEPALARTEFESLLLAPTNPLTPTISQATKAFLALYQADGDLYSACRAGETVMAQAVAGQADTSGRLEIEQMLAAWGYATFSNASELCDLDEVFPLWLAGLRGADLADPIPPLKAAGGLQASAKIDADHDGRQDWLVLLQGESDQL